MSWMIRILGCVLRTIVVVPLGILVVVLTNPIVLVVFGRRMAYTQFFAGCRDIRHWLRRIWRPTPFDVFDAPYLDAQTQREVLTNGLGEQVFGINVVTDEVPLDTGTSSDDMYMVTVEGTDPETGEPRTVTGVYNVDAEARIELGNGSTIATGRINPLDGDEPEAPRRFGEATFIGTSYDVSSGEMVLLSDSSATPAPAVDELPPPPDPPSDLLRTATETLMESLGVPPELFNQTNPAPAADPPIDLEDLAEQLREARGGAGMMDQEALRRRIRGISVTDEHGNNIEDRLVNLDETANLPDGLAWAELPTNSPPIVGTPRTEENAMEAWAREFGDALPYRHDVHSTIQRILARAQTRSPQVVTFPVEYASLGPETTRHRLLQAFANDEHAQVQFIEEVSNYIVSGTMPSAASGTCSALVRGMLTTPLRESYFTMAGLVREDGTVPRYASPEYDDILDNPMIVGNNLSRAHLLVFLSRLPIVMQRNQLTEHTLYLCEDPNRPALDPDALTWAVTLKILLPQPSDETTINRFQRIMGAIGTVFSSVLPAELQREFSPAVPALTAIHPPRDNDANTVDFVIGFNIPGPRIREHLRQHFSLPEPIARPLPPVTPERIEELQQGPNEVIWDLISRQPADVASDNVELARRLILLIDSRSAEEQARMREMWQSCFGIAALRPATSPLPDIAETDHRLSYASMCNYIQRLPIRARDPSTNHRPYYFQLIEASPAPSALADTDRFGLRWRVTLGLWDQSMRLAAARRPNANFFGGSEGQALLISHVIDLLNEAAPQTDADGTVNITHRQDGFRHLFIVNFWMSRRDFWESVAGAMPDPDADFINDELVRRESVPERLEAIRVATADEAMLYRLIAVSDYFLLHGGNITCRPWSRDPRLQVVRCGPEVALVPAEDANRFTSDMQQINIGIEEAVRWEEWWGDGRSHRITMYVTEDELAQILLYEGGESTTRDMDRICEQLRADRLSTFHNGTHYYHVERTAAQLPPDLSEFLPLRRSIRPGDEVINNRVVCMWITEFMYRQLQYNWNWLPAGARSEIRILQRATRRTTQLMLVSFPLYTSPGFWRVEGSGARPHPRDYIIWSEGGGATMQTLLPMPRPDHMQTRYLSEVFQSRDYIFSAGVDVEDLNRAGHVYEGNIALSRGRLTGCPPLVSLQSFNALEYRQASDETLMLEERNVVRARSGDSGAARAAAVRQANPSQNALSPIDPTTRSRRILDID